MCMFVCVLNVKIPVEVCMYVLINNLILLCSCLNKNTNFTTKLCCLGILLRLLLYGQTNQLGRVVRTQTHCKFLHAIINF